MSNTSIYLSIYLSIYILYSPHRMNNKRLFVKHHVSCRKSNLQLQLSFTTDNNIHRFFQLNLEDFLKIKVTKKHNLKKNYLETAVSGIISCF